MTDLREAAQQALEALEKYQQMMLAEAGCRWGGGDAAITALRAALVQEQAEPVQEHEDWCASVTQLLLSYPPQKAPCNCKPRRVEPAQQPVAWLQPKTVDGYSRPDLGYETCSSADYGAFPVYRAPPKADPVQEPVAWMHPHKPDQIRLSPQDGWLELVFPPPKRQPLSGLEVERLLEQVIGSLPVARNLVRAVERAHGIIGSEIRGDSHQTLDDAMHQPRAMAQAYESGYKAGAAAERERIIQFLTEMQRQVGDAHNHYGVAAVRIKEGV